MVRLVENWLPIGCAAKDIQTSRYAIEIPPVVGLPVAGSDELFPVRRVYCTGRNYAAHAIEMGHDPDRAAPFFLKKNANNLDPSGEFPYRRIRPDVHHMAEVSVMLKSGGTGVSVENAFGPCLWSRPFAGYDAPRSSGRTE